MKMNKGSYLLFIEIPEDIVVTISGKEYPIQNGLYTYVGSAMKNLKQRINRHISFQEGGYKKHWHYQALNVRKKNYPCFYQASIKRFQDLEQRIVKE
jgi:Uri superfamily endonuclease